MKATPKQPRYLVFSVMTLLGLLLVLFDTGVWPPALEDTKLPVVEAR